MSNPFDSVRALEADLCAYTGAPYAVAVNSCTMALLLACAWQRSRVGYAHMVSIPKLTYVGVPMSVHHARLGVMFRDEDWQGEYELRPTTPWHGSVWDAARRFTRAMFTHRMEYVVESEPFGIATRRVVGEVPPGPRFQCVSFHVSKILGHSQGGAILHNEPEADLWLRRARFDGRTEGVEPRQDLFPQFGWHCYMSPDVASALIWKLGVLPRDNADLPRSDYRDCSTMPVFRDGPKNLLVE
jgi:hypothetical protein